MNLLAKFKDKENLAFPAKVYKGLKNSNWGRREWVRLTVFLLLFGGIGYLTFRSFAATNVAHPDGSLIQFAGSTSVYMIQGGQKRPIFSANAFNSHGFHWNQIVPANYGDGNLPQGPGMSFRAGTLVEPQGSPSVYNVVDYGNGNYCLYGIPNQTVFYNMGFNYNQVMVVPGSELPSAICAGYMDGSYHAGGQKVNINGTIWMIGNGVKYHVPDPAVDATYPFPVYPPAPYDASLPDAGLIWFNEGSLIKGSSNSVYMVGCSDTAGSQGFCNAQKHGFTSQDIFLGQGFSFTNVNTVPDGDLGGDPTGSPVVEPPPPPPPPPPPVAASTAPTGWMDVPAINTTPTLVDGALITGWAVDKETAIHGVQLYIDGNPAKGGSGNGSNATLGFNDSTACNTAQGSGVGCPNTGWQFKLNIALNNLAIGTHTVRFVATDSDSTPQTYSSSLHNFMVGNGNPNTQPPPPPATCPAGQIGTPPNCTTPSGGASTGSNPPYGVIDSPKLNPVISSGFIASGWAVDAQNVSESKIKSVDVYIDNQKMATPATYGFPRDDVCKADSLYANRPGCPLVGWQYTINTNGIFDGQHYFHVVITDNDNPNQHMQTKDVGFQTRTQTSNTAPPGQTPTVTIENPANFSAASGVVEINGWAVDYSTAYSAPIDKVEVYVDGNLMGVAQKKPRTDVCAKYPVPDCPNVGFSYLLDTTLLSNAQHSVNVRATGLDQYSAKGIAPLTIQVSNNKTTNNRILSDQIDVSTQAGLPMFHLIYMVPADADALGLDHQYDTNGQIATSFGNTLGWMSQKSGGLGLRIDKAGGNYDITFIKTNHNNAEYVAQTQGRSAADLGTDDNNLASLVYGDFGDAVKAGHLSPAGISKKYVLFFDGNAGGYSACGLGGGEVPMVFLQSIDPRNGSHCAASPFGRQTASYQDFVELHEMFHSIGLVSKCALHTDPTATPGSAAYAHVQDSVGLLRIGMDLMYTGANGEGVGWTSFGQPILDAGQDDYFNPTQALQPNIATPGCDAASGVANLKDNPYVTSGS